MYVEKYRKSTIITYSIPTAKVVPHKKKKRGQSWKIKGIVRTLKNPLEMYLQSLRTNLYDLHWESEAEKNQGMEMGSVV